jgi:hypothetical protein
MEYIYFLIIGVILPERALNIIYMYMYYIHHVYICMESFYKYSTDCNLANRYKNPTYRNDILLSLIVM